MINLINLDMKPCKEINGVLKLTKMELERNKAIDLQGLYEKLISRHVGCEITDFLVMLWNLIPEEAGNVGENVADYDFCKENNCVIEDFPPNIFLKERD